MTSKDSWVKAFRANPDETMQMMMNCVEAEAFLKAAVSMAGVGWCIGRLKDIQRNNENVRSMIEIILEINK